MRISANKTSRRASPEAAIVSAADPYCISSSMFHYTTPDCVILCSKDGIIASHNQLRLSFVSEDIVSRPFDSVFHLRYDIPGLPGRSAKTFTINDIIKGHIEHAVLVLHENVNGEVSKLFLSAAPLYVNKNIAGCIVMLTDVTAQKRAEVRMEQHVQDIAFLSQTAMHLVEHVSTADLYTFLAKQVRSILCDAIVLASSYDHGAERITVRSVQMNRSDLEGVTNILGTELQGLSIPCGKDVLSGLHDRNLFKFSGGIYDLLLKFYPKRLCSAIERFLKIRTIYLMPISIGDSFLGALVIITTSPASFKNIHLVEALTNQVTIALRRQKAELLLRDERDKLQKYLDVSGTIFLVIDRDQNVCLINKKGCEILGYAAHEILGKNWFRSYLPQRTRRTTLAFWRNMLRDPFAHITSFENPILTKNGNERIISWQNIVFRDDKGGFAATLSSGEDITEIRQAEEILKRDTASFNAMVKEKTAELLAAQQDLDQKKRLSDIGTLSATIAHELRNPLGVIRLAAHNIMKKTHDTALDKHLLTIENKITESNRIINNVLYFAKFKMPSYEPVPLRPLIEDSILALRRRQDAHPFTLKAEYAISNKDCLSADPIQLRELLDNILNNAYESLFSKKGIIILNVVFRKSACLIKVRDNGIGISASDLRRIYEPFFTRKSKGTGLGLTVCSRIVQLHNGTIDIQSSPGKGTCVTITLPLHHPAPSPASPSLQSAAITPQRANKKLFDGAFEEQVDKCQK